MNIRISELIIIRGVGIFNNADPFICNDIICFNNIIYRTPHGIIAFIIFRPPCNSCICIEFFPAIVCRRYIVLCNLIVNAIIIVCICDFFIWDVFISLCQVIIIQGACELIPLTICICCTFEAINLNRTCFRISVKCVSVYNKIYAVRICRGIADSQIKINISTGRA